MLQNRVLLYSCVFYASQYFQKDAGKRGRSKENIALNEGEREVRPVWYSCFLMGWGACCSTKRGDFDGPMTTWHATSFLRSDFTKARRRENLGTRSLHAKINYSYSLCPGLWNNRVDICTYPFFIRVMFPSPEFGSALFDDQQCTGKRSRLGAALIVCTVALKYKVLPSSTGLGTSPVKLE